VTKLSLSCHKLFWKMSIELEQTLQKRLDESNANKETQFVSFQTKDTEFDAVAVILMVIS
jgi:hypothetical protein